MNVTHTPTPWSFDQYGNVKAHGNRIDNVLLEGFSLNTGRRSEQAKVNTAFIVRACNSHDKLVEALKQAAPILNAWRLQGFTETSAEGGGVYEDDGGALVRRDDVASLCEEFIKIASAALAAAGEPV